MAGLLTIVSWGGHSINDGTIYASELVAKESAAGDRLAAVAIETPLPGDGLGATYVRTDVQPRRLVLHIRVVANTRANLEQLKKWFDPADGPQYLIVADDDSNQRRILAVAERFIQGAGPYPFNVSLLASNPYWEAASLTEPSEEEITTSGETFTLTNPGNARTYPRFTITPNTQADHGNTWIHRRRVVIANRSELPITDPVGDGYPINVFGTTLDTDALNTAGKLQSDLDDLRVVLEGADVNRWPDPSTDNASTRLWCNLQFRPRKTVTLPAISAADDPDDGESITVTNAQGTAGWPESGFFLIDSECIQYTAKTATAFTGLVRGARGTTAASHSAGTAYWVEHPYLDVIYDYTAATNPNPPDDRKPLIDLTNSTNAKHVWGAAFLQAQRRSRGWQPRFTDEGDTAEAIRIFDNANVTFEDNRAVAGKPNFNNIVLDCPVPIDDAAAAVELDFAVGNAFVLRGFLTDLEGNESELITEAPQSAQTNQQYQPTAVAARIRLGARIGLLVGSRRGTGTHALTAGTSQDFEKFAAFTLEAEKVITGILLKVQDGSPASSNGFVVAIMKHDATDSSPPPTDAVTASLELVNADVPVNGAPAEKVFTFAYPVRLPAGTYSVGMRQNGAANNSILFTVEEMGANDQWGNLGVPVSGLTWTLWGAILTEKTEAQSGAPLESGDLCTIDNAELTYDSDRTPKIVVGAEEDFYLFNFRLQNDDTGDYVTVYFPATLGQSIVLDCEARTLVDSETGREIPFAIDASNPAEWPYMQPGASTWSYTEPGVVSVDVAPAFRGRWL